MDIKIARISPSMKRAPGVSRCSIIDIQFCKLEFGVLTAKPLLPLPMGEVPRRGGEGPLSRLRRQLSQRESQVLHAVHDASVRQTGIVRLKRGKIRMHRSNKFLINNFFFLYFLSHGFPHDRNNPRLPDVPAGLFHKAFHYPQRDNHTS